MSREDISPSAGHDPPRVISRRTLREPRPPEPSFSTVAQLLTPCGDRAPPGSHPPQDRLSEDLSGI
ncbi:MAG: hypothetical protein KUG77_17235 [Nannocystaceae bacterium]|nr:hypothetical protein [Nannocystaceae bacterium]